MADITVPPALFDYTFPGRVIEERLPYWEIHQASRQKNRKGRIEGYSWTFPDPRAQQQGVLACHIVLPEAGILAEPDIEKLRRHELGHCNGWPNHHPGARFSE